MSKPKVGDTFRVFEVVDSHKHINGKTGIEIEFDKFDCDLSHHILFERKIINNRMWFRAEELKQVGTIRIKSLKDK